MAERGVIVSHTTILRWVIRPCASDPEVGIAGVGLCASIRRRAARSAREVARKHGTPIYVWEDGKVVPKKS